MVLDIGVDFIPGVSTARSAIELFTGKNIITNEALIPTMIVNPIELGSEDGSMFTL
jgi:hypothetical protein